MSATKYYSFKEQIRLNALLEILNHKALYLSSRIINLTISKRSLNALKATCLKKVVLDQLANRPVDYHFFSSTIAISSGVNP